MFDSLVMTRLSNLATCLCAEVETAELPGLCFCGLLPGAVIAYDYTDSCSSGVCGMGWVRLVSAIPSTGVGVPSEQVNNCGAGLGFDVEVGIIRCIEAMDESGNPPDQTEMLRAADLQIADMLAMRRAILCCGDNGDFLLGPYEPIGPEGGVVGGFWTLTMSEEV